MKRFSLLQGAVTLGLVSLLNAPSQAQLVIVPTFDSSITSSANSAQIQAGINTALAFYGATYSNPVTIHITFVADESVGLGQSSTLGGDISYTAYYNALVAKATTANDLLALALIAPVGGNNPVNGSSTIRTTTALNRAIGLNSFGSIATDSTISLKTSLMNFDRITIDSNKYDLQTTVLHEVNEAIGFGSALNGLNNGAPAPTGAIGTADLFRYDQNGARSFNTAANTKSYFSLNGVTRLERFNQTQGGDNHDWYSDGSNGPAEFAPAVQDAFGTPGSFTNMGPAELAALDVIGYTPKVAATPAPSSAIVLLAGALPLAVNGRRRRKSRKS